MLLACAALLLAAPVPKVATKQTSPKAGLPGINPAAKAAMPTPSGAPTLTRLRNLILDQSCGKSPDALPCKNRAYVRSLAREHDPTKKSGLVAAHQKELLAKTPKQRLEAADQAWSEFKGFYSAYCASPKDPEVCSNALLKTTYTADRRPKPTPVQKPPIATTTGHY